MIRGRRCKDIVEAGAGAGLEPPQHLDATELLDISRPGWHRCRDEASGALLGSWVCIEAVGGEVFGDAFDIPRLGVEAAERDREGMHALVEEEVPPIGWIGLVGHPKPVAVAEAVGKVRDRVG